MGIMDFAKGGVRELMIARPDNAKQLLIYKHSDQNVPMYAQLTVDSDDSALFFKDGKHIGSLPPGVHALQTQKFPFLSQLVTQFTGGNIFVTDLFFVKLSQVRGVALGSALEPMKDPVSAVRVTPRVFGEFSWKVVDPVRFVSGCCGQVAGKMDNDQVLNWIKAKFYLSVHAISGELCSQEQSGLLRLPGLRLEINARMMQRAPQLDEIGVKAVDVNIESINFSSEDMLLLYEAYKERGAAQRGVGIDSDMLRARRAALEQQFQQDARNVQRLAGDWNNTTSGSAMLDAGAGTGAGAGAVPGAAAGGKMTCSSCHATVPVAKFCVNCGTPAT